MADIDTQMADLQKGYIAKLDGKTSQIVSDWEQFLAHDLSQPWLDKVARAIHTIAGTSSILNIKQVSQLCTEIQALLITQTKIDDHESLVIQKINLKIKELRTLITSGNIEFTPIKLKG
ncbi:MAG: HPt (histidine-containing phosphotransfer) domain-containing protein [Zhongshania sp.]